MRARLFYVVFFVAILFGTASVAAPVQAAAYSAEIIDAASPLTLTPGEHGTVSLLIKNTGSAVWPISGRGYVSAYTFDPKYHLSRLEDKTWRRRDQPATIAAAIKPGASGYLRFPVTAPQEPGVYEETFQLAAEDAAWIAGGKFSVKVTVKKNGTATPPSVSRNDTAVASTTVLPHKALLLVRSHRKIEASGGETVLMRFGFKNVGDTLWAVRGIADTDVALAAFDPSGLPFAHESWISSREVMKIATGVVSPGDTEFYTFSVKVPDKSGAYNLHLALTVGGQTVDGGAVEIPVTVTADAPNTSGEPVPFSGEIMLAPEPRIRVGLYKTEEPVEFKSAFPYVVKDVNGAMVYELPVDTQAILHFKNNQYTFYAKGTTLTSDTHFRFEPAASSTDPYFEIQNHEDRPTWNKSLNYNQFRGTFELRYSKENDKVWAVNELPMEQYLAGLAEISEYKATEFHKAMAVAERTYAYYQLQDGRKHATRNFDVNASEGDQVYAGYVRERAFPKVVDGVHASAGEMMTYNKDVVVTPYFAQSSGRTYSWKEVWGGKDKPWLVSVIAHYDTGRIKYGHGVGMSQYDASKRAEKEGLDYKTLLKYYYRGVEVEKIYR